MPMHINKEMQPVGNHGLFFNKSLEIFNISCIWVGVYGKINFRNFEKESFLWQYS